MSEKKPELQINTSLKNMGTFVKLLVGVSSAGLIGAAGAAVGQSRDDSAATARIDALEAACGKYDVRLAMAETKMQNVEANVLDIKKDLAEIRATNVQILLILKNEK